MLNFPIPLLALVAANRAGDSPGDAGRVALMSMMLRPPILGLLVAMTMARQAAKPKPVISNSSAGTSTRKGTTVFDQVAPKANLHSFFPSFGELTRKQAAQFAKELGLTADFVEMESRGKEMVIDQDPAPGARWPHDLKKVTLTLG